MIRRPLFLLLSIVLFVGAVGFLAYRPATVTGVEGDQLASSLKGAARGNSAGCQHVRGDVWRCHVRRHGGSGLASYRVAIHSFGCWQAHAAGRRGDRLPRRPSGCITVFDYF